MWYIHYGLHFTITHSLFKSQSQMCSKLHQLFWKKKARDICSRQTVHHLNTNTKNLVLFLTKKGGIAISHSQFSTTNSYPQQNNYKLGLNILFFQSSMRTYATTIPGVLSLVYWYFTTSLWIYSQIPQNKKIN